MDETTQRQHSEEITGKSSIEPNPFIPGTSIQHSWDSTSLGWLKECPRKYQYSMVEGWVTRGEQVNLEFGILYHSALEHYDKYKHFLMLDHDTALRMVVKEALRATWRDGKPWRASKDLELIDKTPLKCREFLIRTIVWYLDRFKNDPAQTRINPATKQPMVELHFQFEIGAGIDLKHPYVLCGYLDRVVNFQGDSYAMDRKTTTSTLGSHYFEQYDPDNQMSLYTLASQIAFHTPVKGVIVDAAQIAVGFSRFGRSFVTKTKEQMEEWLKDLKVYLDQARGYADRGYWPQNDKSCHKYGGCVFREICNKSPVVREKFLESHFDRRQWNPLIPR